MFFLFSFVDFNKSIKILTTIGSIKGEVLANYSISDWFNEKIGLKFEGATKSISWCYLASLS